MFMTTEEKKNPYQVWNFEPPYTKIVYFNGKDYTGIIRGIITDFKEVTSALSGEVQRMRVPIKVTIYTYDLETESGGTTSFAFDATDQTIKLFKEGEEYSIVKLVASFKNLMDLKYERIGDMSKLLMDYNKAFYKKSF